MMNEERTDLDNDGTDADSDAVDKHSSKNLNHDEIDSDDSGSDSDEDDKERHHEVHDERLTNVNDAGDGKTSKEKKKKEKKEKKEQKQKKVHRLSLTETEDFNAKLKKRGVIYIARIPPKMTPTKIKRLLSEFGGEVTRVYLVEEDAAKRKRRKKELGGSGGKRYVEGWVEFEKKKVAKHVAMSLNTTPISNHKRDPHFGDLWALKYLPKFSWSHLTEKVAYERRVREQKLRIEMMQARRENASYIEMVETGKKLDKIELRRNNNASAGNSSSSNNNNNSEKRQRDDDHDDDNKKKQRRRNKHHQVQPVRDGGDKPANLALLKTLV
jgi:ESF2/ABP1 family protein